jgi:hypothetical protein
MSFSIIKVHGETELITEIFKKLCTENRKKLVFFDKPDLTLKGFIFFVANSPAFYAVLHKGEVRGFCYLSHFDYHSCRVHFCTFDNARHLLFSGVPYVLEWLFQTYKLLYFHIPAENAKSVRYLKMLGTKVISIIPEFYLCYLKREMLRNAVQAHHNRRPGKKIVREFFF